MAASSTLLHSDGAAVAYAEKALRQEQSASKRLESREVFSASWQAADAVELFTSSLILLTHASVSSGAAGVELVLVAGVTPSPVLPVLDSVVVESVLEASVVVASSGTGQHVLVELEHRHEEEVYVLAMSHAAPFSQNSAHVNDEVSQKPFAHAW